MRLHLYSNSYYLYVHSPTKANSSYINGHMRKERINCRWYNTWFNGDQRNQRKQQNAIHHQQKQIDELSQTIDNLPANSDELSDENEKNYIDQSLTDTESNEEMQAEWKLEPKWDDNDLMKLFELMQRVPGIPKQIPL